jgi:hypothetical protein
MPGSCAGDCDQRGSVTVDELILGVAITLNERALRDCPGLDHDGDGIPSVADAVAAVSSALRGCGAGQ